MSHNTNYIALLLSLLRRRKRKDPDPDPFAQNTCQGQKARGGFDTVQNGSQSAEQLLDLLCICMYVHACVAQEGVEVRCEFCNESIKFEPKEFASVIED